MSKFLPKLSSRHPLADETMLKYFVSTLEVRVAMIENTLTRDPPNEDASGGPDAEGQVANAAERVADAGGGRRNTHTAALLADIKAKLAAFFDQYKENRFGVVDDAWCDAYRLERLLALIEPAIRSSLRCNDVLMTLTTKPCHLQLAFGPKSRHSIPSTRVRPRPP